MPVKSSAVLFIDTSANPLDVIKVKSTTLPDPEGNQVLLRGMAAFLNPSDFATVQGTYGTIPERTTTYTKEPAAIIGNDGIFEVLAVGKDAASQFNKGDWVLSNKKAFGTWRSYALVEANTVALAPKTNDPIISASIAINPTTAYQMLKAYVDLKPGDWVVQDAANSAVGRAVIQLAHIWGLKTLNIVRDRPNLKELEKELKELGADLVVTDKNVADPEFISRKLPELTNNGNVRLGLECVGGEDCWNTLCTLSHGGTLVVYGSMTGKAAPLEAGRLIFKDLTIKSYWLTPRLKSQPEFKKEAVDTILGYIKAGKFQSAPVQRHIFKVNGTEAEQLEAVRAAFKAYSVGFANKKQTIIFE